MFWNELPASYCMDVLFEVWQHGTVKFGNSILNRFHASNKNNLIKQAFEALFFECLLI